MSRAAGRFRALRDAYRRGDLKPSGALVRCYEAIAASEVDDPPIHAMSRLLEERARAEAAASDARWAKKEPLSPLDGAPIAVKEVYDVEGVSTTDGVKAPPPPAARDALVVRRLTEAGAVILAKTHMTELGMGVTGINVHHGTPRNPFDPSRGTGGSSSGSGAAIAAGLCAAATGSDTGGSIRNPSAQCGLVGLKPTYGAIPEDGYAALTFSMEHLGPMAATAEDCAALFSVMAGREVALPEDPGAAVKGLRVATLDELPPGDAEPDVAARVEAAIDALASNGARRATASAPLLRYAKMMHLTITIADGASMVEPLIAEGSRALGPDMRIALEAGARILAVDYLRAQRARRRLMEECARALRDVDVFAMPTTAIAAPLLHPKALEGGEIDIGTLDALLRYIYAWNLTGLPAISVPCGTNSSGLPVGIQLVAAPGREALLLAIAAALEAFGTAMLPRPRRWYGEALWPSGSGA